MDMNSIFKIIQAVLTVMAIALLIVTVRTKNRALGRCASAGFFAMALLTGAFITHALIDPGTGISESFSIGMMTTLFSITVTLCISAIVLATAARKGR